MSPTDAQPAQAPAPTRARSRRKMVWLLFLGAVLLFLAWLGIKGYRTAVAAQSLLARQSEVENLMAGGLTGVDPDAAEELLLGVRQDVVTLKRETAVFMPLTPYLGRVPKVGSTLVAAPELMEMADAGTETAVVAFQGLKPALALLQSEEQGGSQMAALVQVLDEAEPELIQANQSFARLAAARAALGDTGDLPWRLRTLLDQADSLLPLGQDGLQVALILPELMGIDEPHTYLIIAQNEDEIRPTGGFITGAGLLQVADGRIVSLSFQDGNRIDDWANKPYDFPPQPYYDFMGSELFLYRDANFWSDFPTSAETAIRLYSYGQGVPEPDGAIAIDQKFVEYLLRGMGPLTLPETGAVVNQANVRQHFQEAWAKGEDQEVRDWFRERKSFLSTFGEAIQAKIETGLAETDPLALVQNLYTAVKSRHLQIYMRDPAMATVFDGLNWDGRLENVAGQDALAIVDTNMGFNKVNMSVTRQVDYEVMLAADGRGTADVTIQYHNNAPFEPGDEGCYQDTIEDYSRGPSYLELADECYWNYLRVYAPGGSTLIDSSSHTAPGHTFYRSQGWQGGAQPVNEFTGWQTFANFILVPQQETVTVSLQYALPAAVTQSDGTTHTYRLTLIPQAGMASQPTTVRLTLPPGTEWIYSTPDSPQVNGNQVSFNLLLEQVTILSVTYRQKN